MFRGDNSHSLSYEQQAKFIQDRITNVEKNFGELCVAFGDYARRTARLRDQGDELAKVLKDYANNEIVNKSLSAGLENVSITLTAIEEYRNCEVQRLEAKVIGELCQYEAICKHAREELKHTMNVREKELARKKVLDKTRERQPFNRQQVANRSNLDGYLLYLQGVVLKKLDLRSQAVTALQSAVSAVPVLWCAWVELAGLANEYDALDSLQLPKHWMMYFFAAHAFVELKLSEQALEGYMALAAAGFDKSTYVVAQTAIAHHDRRDVDSSLALFRELCQIDPYRLDNWDVYSHLLYLKERRMELAHLAQRAVSIDKYRVETCCVIGNYYSLRSEHQKAVIYFQRALSLDPQYLSAWILMGHEFIELQNSNAAIQCYRQAVDVDRNDYRAWNGLGQAYEILGLNGYCIYYYSRAAQLKPDDSRMLVSLGEAYEKMDKIPNALKCYYKAHSTGDIEGMALFKLAKLYEKSNMPNSAAAAYTAACQDPANAGSKELPPAMRYLAHYYLRFSLLDHAAHYAYKCLEHDTTKEAGKNLLKTISEKRLSASTSQPHCSHEELPEAIKHASAAAATSAASATSAAADKTPLPSPSPNVTPDNFSTPMFTRRNSKYKM